MPEIVGADTKSGIPHRPALAVLLLSSTLAVMAGAALAPVVEVMRGDLHVNGTAAGLILTIHALVLAVASPVAGWTIDRFGIRAPLAGGLLLYGLAGTAGIVTTSYPALILGRVAFGIGAAFVFAGTTVALLSIYQGSLRNRVMGWRTAATSFGGVIFPIIGGAIASTFSWHATFGLYGVGIPLGLTALAVLPDERKSDRSDRDRSPYPALHMLTRPILIGVFFLVALQAVMLYALVVFLPLRLGALGLQTPFLVSTYMALMAGASSIIGMVFGWLGRQLLFLDLLRLTGLTWAIAFLLLGTSSNFIMLAAASAVLGIGNALGFSTTSVMIGEYVPEALLGRAMAIFSTCMFLGQFAAPLLLGPLMELTSITTGYLALSASSGTLVMVLLVLRKPNGKNTRTNAR